jgi:hypothetical protein
MKVASGESGLDPLPSTLTLTRRLEPTLTDTYSETSPSWPGLRTLETVKDHLNPIRQRSVEPRQRTPAVSKVQSLPS